MARCRAVLTVVLLTLVVAVSAFGQTGRGPIEKRDFLRRTGLEMADAIDRGELIVTGTGRVALGGLPTFQKPEVFLLELQIKMAEFDLSPSEASDRIRDVIRETAIYRRGLDGTIALVDAEIARIERDTQSVSVEPTSLVGEWPFVLQITDAPDFVGRSSTGRIQVVFGVYPGFPTIFSGLLGFFVGDFMGKALWQLVENAQRFPRRGGRVLCVHGAVSFHGARPWATRWLPGRGARRDVELDRCVLGLRSGRCSHQNRRPVQAERSIYPGKTEISGTYALWETRI